MFCFFFFTPTKVQDSFRLPKLSVYTFHAGKGCLKILLSDNRKKADILPTSAFSWCRILKF
ncbi:hypothetical protein BFO_0727 [Tannerella forsythia 92A2]|uniref:Uncharacterized protein n=1 Tax=Tannerella forsythia (strain ATCC 43037 / JCM 10827 / CCUG 21028 A / KCTC 5666 / FDC 338) TaxID=203275 RepID=G8UN05_TANFA|nr:hypothetical protein BFO_0727 [Tannerella forsythia 92A2]